MVARAITVLRDTDNATWGARGDKIHRGTHVQGTSDMDARHDRVLDATPQKVEGQFQTWPAPDQCADVMTESVLDKPGSALTSRCPLTSAGFKHEKNVR